MAHAGGPPQAPPQGGPPPAPPQASGDVGLSQEKACQILKDGQVNGKKLTPPQINLMQARCSGSELRQAANGAVVDAGWHRAALEVDAEFLEAVTSPT